ncbi:MAG: M81 family metallopeptidase [Betaproteobacteria bacterium]|nr:M81 family metallopeptidase [Betaproteobacteria bacterium]
MRIAIGGFQHETNTFAPSLATFDDFARGGGWPPLLQGGDIFDGVAGINLPIAGFIEGMRDSGHTLVPTAWAAASPSAHVTRDAYERIAGMIVESIAHAGAIDAVYLDLHGAMVAQHLPDGEGELLTRVRRLVGDHLPVVASLDLHANVTQRMLQAADILIAYRTYPHVDMADAGQRVAHFLQRRLAGAPRPVVASRPISYLIPLQAQSTMLEPAQSLYAWLPQLEGAGVDSVSFTPGFPAADFPECGALAFAYGNGAARAVHTLAERVEGHEADFDLPVFTPEEAIRRAQAMARGDGRPVVIADTQDNPGAGGDSDTTGLLRALVSSNTERAALGLIADAEAARAAHAVGQGGSLDIALGGKSGIAGDAPLHARYSVEQLSDGKLTGTGPFYRGARMTLGPCARLRVGSVQVIVSTEKVQLADQQMYRFIGIEPTQQAILAVKSSAHFRADFAPIAREILVCKAPGPMLADPSEYPWRDLRPGIKLRPKGQKFRGESRHDSGMTL